VALSLSRNMRRKLFMLAPAAVMALTAGVVLKSGIFAAATATPAAAVAVPVPDFARAAAPQATSGAVTPVARQGQILPAEPDIGITLALAAPAARSPAPDTGGPAALMLAAQAAPAPTPMPEAQPEPTAQNDCAPVTSATSVPGGMAYVVLNLPCAEPGPLRVSHGAMVFDDWLGAGGRYARTVPVLDLAEPYLLEHDGRVYRADLGPASAAGYDHVVLQWSGDLGFQIHALEFGAGYGDPGHVWDQAPKDIMRGVRADGGFLTRLGGDQGGQVAEVYSLPTGQIDHDGTVRLTVEVEVSARNCMKDIAGQALQVGQDGRFETVTITFAMPDCDAIGDILVLKNLLEDLTIAGN